MKIKNMIAVSGHPTLMSLVSTRNNGLMLKDPVTGKTNFFAVRTHQFTPLETVGIYTTEDTAELKTVFTSMLNLFDTIPPVSPKSSNKELMDYFGQVLPDFDRDRVYPGDIKKVIKWFNTLKELGYLTAEEEETKDLSAINDTEAQPNDSHPSDTHTSITPDED